MFNLKKSCTVVNSNCPLLLFSVSDVNFSRGSVFHYQAFYFSRIRNFQLYPRYYSKVWLLYSIRSGGKALFILLSSRNFDERPQIFFLEFKAIYISFTSRFFSYD